MAFASFKKSYPRRCWGLRGYAVEGKSTLAARMRGPLLVIDTDGRFNEVVTCLDLAPGTALSISENQADHSDPYRIQAILEENKGSPVGTIVIDSITGILQPRIVTAMRSVQVAKQAGEKVNKSAVWMDKAMAMRAIIDPVQSYGSDFLMLWHKEDGRNGQGHESTRETVSRTELDRLYRALNLELEMVTERDRAGDPTRFGVKVIWARLGKSGMTLWDEPGNFWRGMPERIEEAVYGKNLEFLKAGAAANPPPVTDVSNSPARPAEPKDGAPAGGSFSTMREALIWSVENGAFANHEDAKAEYERSKRDLAALHDPLTPEIVFAEWRKIVDQRALPKAG